MPGESNGPNVEALKATARNLAEKLRSRESR